MRAAVVSMLSVAAWASVGCGPSVVPVDPRVAQVERLPADAALVVQADMPAVADVEALDRWFARVRRMSDALPDASCLADLAGRATVVTTVGLINENGCLCDGAMMVAGDVTSLDLATCFQKILQPFDSQPPRPSGGPGRYTVGEGNSAMIVTDMPGGAGVAVGTPIGIEAVLAPAAEGGGTGLPLMTRLRGLTGGGELEVYFLRQVDQGLAIDGAALALRRGRVDRYEAVLVTPSEADAQMAAFAAMGSLAMAAGVEGMLAEDAGSAPPGDPGGDVLREILPAVAAFADALRAGDVAVDGNVVRVVLEIDPAAVGPTDLAALTGMMLLFRGAAMGASAGDDQGAASLAEPDNAPMPDPPDYSVPGLPAAGSTHIELPPDK